MFDIKVQPQQYARNDITQTCTILIYFYQLNFALHNSYKYLLKKQRYKVVPVMIFYFFAVCLCLTRILQHAFSYKYYVKDIILHLNFFADNF